jgi:hypothetical protein
LIPDTREGTWTEAAEETEEGRSDGGWRKLRNAELYDVYSSPSIIRIIKFREGRGETCNANGEKKTAYRLLVGKPKGDY